MHDTLTKRLEVLRQDWLIADAQGKRLIEFIAQGVKRQLGVKPEESIYDLAKEIFKK